MTLLPASTPLYDFSGSITMGGTPQVVLPKWESRSYLLFENTSAGTLYLEFGGARGKAVVSSGSISSISAINAGFNYTYPPKVVLIGGGGRGGLPDGLSQISDPACPTPSSPALAHATASGGSVSFVVDYGGGGYVGAPYVWTVPDPRDPYGAAAPSATVGFALAANGSLVLEASYVSPDQVSVFGATTGQTYVCKVAR